MLCFFSLFSDRAGAETLVRTDLGLGGAKHKLDLDLTPYMESVSEDENPLELESEELEVDLKNRTSES